ncbi:MAG: hypothetical protein CDV28_1233 [Candidatus Electronema aureum]|uniref:DUF1634 domain-containing protein n=1 Tax=Candidatus Electronema aureum TaxID=2005002 RepID=A0A521G0Z5_9BACT|nr:MAG: hypothetical protein CDV28_1233 [Candidatus Electronema aureum]
MANEKNVASEEQLLYATWLEKGMLIGLVLIVISFALYVTGIISPVVPLDELSNYWNLPVKDYLAAVNNNFLHLQHPPTGWAWLTLLGKGDFLNFLPIAILSGITMLCYAVIVPVFMKKGDKAYMIMAIVEVLILALAASGLLKAGH